MFYDKLVGIKYGTPDDENHTNGSSLAKEPPKLEAQPASTNGGDSSPPSPSRASSPSAASEVASSTDAGAAAPTKETTPAAEMEAAGSPGAADAADAAADDPMDVATSPKAATPATVTPTGGVKSEAAAGGEQGEETKPAAGQGEGGGGARGGPFRVSMRLSNEMPEFMVVASKYDEATTYPWRSEMHIQMAFMEEPGMYIGTRTRDRSLGRGNRRPKVEVS